MNHGNEPTILEYARSHGLASNYLDRNPLAGLRQPDDFLQQLENMSDGLEGSKLNDDCSDERLFSDEAATSLLASVTVLTEQSLHFDEDKDIDPHRFREIKYELPMLRSDHELDMKSFGTQVVPDLEREFLPLEKVDEEVDEGLEWPIKYCTLLEEFAYKVQSEKLQISNDGLVYLRDIVKSSNEGKSLAFQDEALMYNRNKAIDPVTPPLLPLTPPFEPFVPSSEAGYLELLSDKTSPTRQELHDADRSIFEKDTIVPQKRNFGDISEDPDPMLLDIASVESFYSPLKGIQDPPSSPHIKRVQLLDRKVECPLTPLSFERSPPWANKAVTFSDALQEIMPQLPLPVPNPEEPLSDDIGVFFAESIEPIAIKAERSIEQEQLLEADTTRRVSVPVMDFSLPKAPWKELGHGDQVRNSLCDLEKTHLGNTKWPGDGKSERELSWVPFPASVRKNGVGDDISDADLDLKYLTQPECVDSSTLIWKREGLRLLDDRASSEDEDLDYGSFTEGQDLDYLVRKRQLEMEEDRETHLPKNENGSNFTRRKLSTASSQGHDYSRKLLQADKERDDLSSAPALQDQGPERFSAMNALDRFMYIRKGETYQSDDTAKCPFPCKDQVPSLEDNTRGQQSAPYLGKENTKRLEVVPSLPLPQIALPSGSQPFVISTSFLRNRKLARCVQNLYPAADFIERDFALYSSARSTSLLGTKFLPSDTDAMADEADMIVSPGTGLILTTLQKIKQRPLPGQAARLHMHEHILRATPRYERLVIMITEDNKTISTRNTNETISELTNSDWEAIADFMGFCSSLQGDIQCFFIAGEEEQYAQWIVAMMVKYGMNDPQVNLLQDETLWEIFLRKAGLNAFAAQCVLSELKAPDQSIHGPQEQGDFGLNALIRMPLKERLTRFERLFGGRNLLIRVSKVLDATW